ncbi:MAG: aldo/keto reductase [Pseudomonadota bacterium]
MQDISRRAVLGAVTAAPLLAAAPAFAAAQLTKPIPASGQPLPVIGMGTWITFNVGDDPVLRQRRVEVLRAFFEAGGGMVDSSPMYASAEEVMGHCLEQLGPQPSLFSATKVWTSSPSGGQEQIEASHRLWRLPRFDLLQVHNLVGWEAHLERLFAMRAAGEVGYVGITTSHRRRHGDVAALLEGQPLDFLQLTYNPVDRAAEARLLPLAQERGVAVIVNRPFQGGRLVDRAQRTPLPAWAADIDCENWPQILLKYAVSHPVVTCAIPATSQVTHMRENMGAGRGRLPDAAERRRIEAAVAEL